MRENSVDRSWMGSIGINNNNLRYPATAEPKSSVNLPATNTLNNSTNGQESQDRITIEQCEKNKPKPEQQVQLSDLIGEYGAYQLAITLLLFIRYVFLGLMANSGPLMTPDVTFYCSLPMTEVLSIMPNISTLSALEQEIEIKEEFKQICQIDLHLYQNQTYLHALNGSKSFKTSPLSKDGNLNLNSITNFSANSMPRTRECVDFTYDLAPDQGRTMTTEFDLVCDRDWLRSLFQSLLSASIVISHVFWGTFSDKYGRFQAQRLCLAVSLIAGLLSIFATDFWSFTLTRALCSFGDLGLVVSQTTTVVELVGQRYRGPSVALVNFGFALGVSLLPYIVAYFEDFRVVIGFTVMCHLITIPFVLATNESPRWLLTNRRFEAARKELKRIARGNRACATFWNSIKALFNRGDEIHLRVKPKSEQKQYFEELFKKIAEQIDIQNLYDPVMDASVVDIRSPVSPKLNPTIVHQPLISQQFFNGSAKFDRDMIHKYKESAIHTDPTDHYRVQLNPPLLEIFVDSTHKKSSCNTSSCVNSSSSGGNDRLVNNESPLGRALSQNHLDTAAMSSLYPINTDDAISQSQHSVRATLPDLKRALSANELLDQPDRQGNLEFGGRSQQNDCITSCNMVAHQLSFVGRVNRLFRDKKLMIAVFTIVWTTFNSELLYTSFIIINLEVGEDVYFNYMLGGCMEALAAISASLLLSYSPRRVSLIAFWLLISISCFGLSLAHIDSTWAVWMLALAKFSQSSLSSIASVAAYESFPTFLRQSGSGLVFTLGMMGSVLAPLIFAEFDDHTGMDRVLMTFSCSALIAATLIYMFLRETRGCELK